MPNNRFKAIERSQNREIIDIKLPSVKISDYFASNVFNIDTMRRYLSHEAFESMTGSITSGQKIDRNIADQIAVAMKEWAMSKGATSYCHWFQPLTGATAEKHDTFFTPLDANKGIETFNGDALVQQEPDGSSFPSGGLRVTFEARGYTAWDPSSPAFIMSVGTSGKTLCIPTIFVSFTGESLDYKAPLLKSQHFLETAAVDVCNYFDRNITKVYPTLGWEQEYFLIDEALYYARPDIATSGRTLIGSPSVKGQQLEDHYFGSIPERVYAYMLDFETEAHKLGITIRTRHNEVAPGQYECAPVFSEANIAVDHNQLLMDLMDRVARRHKLRVLFHEKPFAGVNGSGKHNNWSLATNTGKNLLSPGKTPKNNLRFLTFFINTIKAVNDNADLLRAAIASAGNDHRLGANEAPPAIISVFIGTTLTKVLDELEDKIKKGSKMDEFEKSELKLDIHNKIPDLMLDNTDRNRTSPFAFTGNKFEFRAVGSSANCGLAMTILNAIVGSQLIEFKKDVEDLVKEGEKRDGAILRVLRRYVTDSRRILFEGDNYSKEWEEEANKRGLSNVKTTPHALGFFKSKAAHKVLVETGLYSHRELHARYDVWLEQYQRKIDIEAGVLTDMILSQVIPAAVKYQQIVASSVRASMDIGYTALDFPQEIGLVKTLANHVNNLKKTVDTMNAERKTASELPNAEAKAVAFCEKVKPFFEKIRESADALEDIVDDELWPLPKYRELFFMK
ncbi:MAG: glutamine synthetase III [Sphingobacteriales bacterium]|nr:MAG: glutamine synthetase III [Sphingobacteriales bacterium]